jgi:integrase
MKRGGVREVRGKLYARARFGSDERIEVRVPWTKDHEKARERAEVIGEVLSALVAAGRRDLVKATARELADAPTPARLAVVQKAIAAILKGAMRAGAARDITIREWGRRYTSGELSREHPDKVKVKDFTDDDSRLRLYVYPHVGDVPVVAFTAAHAELVMSKLPPDKIRTPAARRHVAQVMGRLMNLAVMPGRLLPSTPLPKGWLPFIPKRRHYSCLWPNEEAALLACEAVPLVFRLACGVLNREGMRVSELLDSEWRQWDIYADDLKGRGTFLVTRTKTGDPRMWALSPSVARAMLRWRRIMERELEPGAELPRPFAALDDVTHRTKLAEFLRASLKTAGVTRPELFETTEHTARLRAHDMRATFVTISLAQGRDETWVRDRTAHKTTTMIDRYRRLARQVKELDLGPLVDLETGLAWGSGDQPGEDPSDGGDMVGENLNEYRRRDSNPHAQRAADFESPTPSRAGAKTHVSPGDRGGSRRLGGSFPRSSPTPSATDRDPSTLIRSAAADEGEPTSSRVPGRPGPVAAVPRLEDAPASARPLLAAAGGLAVQRATWDAFDALAAAELDELAKKGGRS